MPSTIADFLQNISPNSLNRGYGGYDQSFEQYVDSQGNVYTPTRGGEMNDVISYEGIKNINGDTVNVKYDQAGNIVSATGQPQIINGQQVVADYSPNGQVSYREYAGPETFMQSFGPILGMAATAFGIPGMIGGALAPAASAATQAALGGAVVGGSLAGAGGGDVLKGALLGGVGGYLSGGLGDTASQNDFFPIGGNAGTQLTPAAIESGLGIAGYGANAAAASSGLFNPGLIGAGANLGSDALNSGLSISDLAGTGGGVEVGYNPPGAELKIDYSLGGNGNLDDMGGGQGLLPDTTGNLVDMGGAQGLNADNILSGLSDMGGGQGIIYKNPVTGVDTSLAGSAVTGADLLGGNLGNDLAALTTNVKDIDYSAPKTPTGTPKERTLLGDLTTGNSLVDSALINAGTGLVGNLVSNNAISNAANSQAAAAQQAGATLKDIYNQQLGFVQPYQQTGQQGLNAITSNLPYLQHQFNAADLQAGLAPNYDFMLQQGQMANQRAANVGGGALGGNALTGLQRYTQDYAGNAYQNAFNNYQTQRNNIYNTLSNIAGLGQTANQQAIGAGTGYGQQQTALTTGLAAAQAGANVAQATNTANTLNNIANNVTLASLLGQKQAVA